MTDNNDISSIIIMQENGLIDSDNNTLIAKIILLYIIQCINSPVNYK
jgi:hypothetical protein